jgi:hypothetical protein
VYEADQKYAKILCEEFGLGSVGMDSSCSKSEVSEVDPPLKGD